MNFIACTEDFVDYSPEACTRYQHPYFSSKSESSKVTTFAPKKVSHRACPKLGESGYNITPSLGYPAINGDHGSNLITPVSHKLFQSTSRLVHIPKIVRQVLWAYFCLGVIGPPRGTSFPPRYISSPNRAIRRAITAFFSIASSIACSLFVKAGCRRFRCASGRA